MSAGISRQQVKTRGYTLKEEYKQMSKNLFIENLELKQQLLHAERQVQEYYQNAKDWEAHYHNLEEVHTGIVQRHKRKVDNIKKKARSNPWPWVISGICLITGLLIGMAI